MRLPLLAAAIANVNSSRGSSVGIATGYGFDGREMMHKWLSILTLAFTLCFFNVLPTFSPHNVPHFASKDPVLCLFFKHLVYNSFWIERQSIAWLVVVE
jgi:hypothetical protein